jgi:hypothetical protein
MAPAVEELLHGIFVPLRLIGKDDLLGGSCVRLEDANSGDVRLPDITALKTLPVAGKLPPPPLLLKLVKVHTTAVPGLPTATIFGDGALHQCVVKGGFWVILCCPFN